LAYETSNNLLQRIIRYLGDSVKFSENSFISEEKIIEDLKLSKRDIRENLQQGLNLGLIKMKEVIYCEHCGEDIREVKPSEKVVGKEETCEYCGSVFIVTEDHIRRYYRLTFKGEELFNKKLNQEQSFPWMPKLKMLPYYIDKKCEELGGEVLKDYFIIILLHFLRDLIPFVEGLKKFGAEPKKCYLICKPYPYAYKDWISSFLRDEGYNIIIVDDFDKMEAAITLTLEEIEQKIKKENGHFIIVEDGGYITPILHKKFKDIIPYCKGTVEQTTKGIRRDKEVKDLQVPILNVAECKFKKDYEPRFVARAVVQNLQNMLPDKHFDGNYALVIGYGAIGSKIVESLHNNLNMRVYVADKDKSQQLKAKGDKNVAEVLEPADVKNHTKEHMLVIGATGERSIDKEEINSLKHGTILASASSDRGEINVEELELLAGKENKRDLISRDGQKIGTLYKLERLNNNEITLLADGYPINFYYSESVPNESFDPILTTLFLSVLEVATKKISPGISSEVVDELVERERIIDKTIQTYFSH